MMIIDLIKRILLVAFVLFVIWWIIWGLKDSQIDSFQKHRAHWVNRAHSVENSVESTYKKLKP